jgi:PIN domain nuclease of toxin-antitoxin system
MSYLLDTHVFLWALFSPNKLSDKVFRILSDASNPVNVSAINFWEISLKYGLGKIQLSGVEPKDLTEYALEAGFGLLPLDPEISATVYQLEADFHKDPFDRLLIWQAMKSSMTLISHDERVKAYQEKGLSVIW